MATRLSKSGKDLETVDFFDKNTGNDDDDENESKEEFVEQLLLKNNLIDEEIVRTTKKRKLKPKSKEAGVVTLTQMVNKKTKAKRAEQNRNVLDPNDDEDDDDGNDDDSDSNEAATETKTTTGSQTAIHVYLSALEGGSKQKISLLKLLYDIKPKYVVLYNIELRFVRQVEIYRTCNFNLNMRVYFCMYTNSIEEQRYLTAIRSEKESFELLIKEKAVIQRFHSVM